MLTPVRHDRDDFIHINESNIEPEMRNDFVKREYGNAEFHETGNVDTHHTPYDVASAHRF